MRRQLLPAVRMLLAITVLCGLIYALAVTGIAQVVFRPQAKGSLVYQHGQPVGSRLLGQEFTKPKYFHPRPSAADDYSGDTSAASNFGPTNPAYLKMVEDRVAKYRSENGLSSKTLVPVDAVTASGSGLDPDISIANARLQAARIAGARHIPKAEVNEVINRHIEHRSFGIFGERRVNVLEMNLALDKLNSP